MSEWTTDTLKALMDERFRGQEEALHDGCVQYSYTSSGRLRR